MLLHLLFSVELLTTLSKLTPTSLCLSAHLSLSSSSMVGLSYVACLIGAAVA